MGAIAGDHETMKAFAYATLALVPLLAFAQPTARPDRLVAIFVVDGLRPDSINQADTPTIARLRTEGVDYLNSHSIFPTSTRVNAAALITGTYPARHGIVGNSMFVAGVNPQAPFDTGDHTQLMRLEDAEGRVVTTPTLAEVLSRHGRKVVTLSSGTTGNGFLLNPQARHGAGVAIHGLFDPGKDAAYPREISDVVIRRFGSPPPDPDDVGQMEWTDTVLRDYVLPELRPDVVIDWMGPLDAAQHAHGVGSPAGQGRAASHRQEPVANDRADAGADAGESSRRRDHVGSRFRSAHRGREHRAAADRGRPQGECGVNGRDRGEPVAVDAVLRAVS